MTLRLVFTAIAALALTTRTTHATAIFLESTTIHVAPGSSVSVKWYVESAVPLLGYSLAIERVPPGARSGDDVEIDTSLTTFFDPQNLITAGGAVRDPLFSVISSDGSGGVFVSTNTEDLAAVLPVAGINDVLVQAEFTIDAAATGDWLFRLGTASALADADGNSIPFSSEALTISVIPSPGASAFVLCTIASFRRRRR